MSSDQRIRERFLMLDDKLPTVDVGAAFDQITNEVEKDGTRQRRWVAVGVAAAAAVAVAAGATVQMGLLRTTPAPPVAPPEPPAGSMVFANQQGLHIVDEDGMELRTIDDGGFPTVPPNGDPPWTIDYGGFPSFSPDGSQLAYVFPGMIGVPSDVKVADTDGENSRTLVDCTRSGLDCGAPAWSPDGTEIAVPVFGERARDELRIVPLDGGVSRTFTMPDGEGFDYPVWSPDGSLLLGVHYTARGARLATMDPSIGFDSLRDMGATYPRIDRPDWSPDGSAIAFTAGASEDPRLDDEHPSELYAIDSDGQNLRRISSIPAEDGRLFGVDWTNHAAPFLVTVLDDDRPDTVARVAEDGTVWAVMRPNGRPLQGWHAVELP